MDYPVLTPQRKGWLAGVVVALLVCLAVNSIVYATSAYQLSKPVPATVNIQPYLLLGDADGDGAVGLTDLVMVASAFNTSPPSIPTADLNHDNIVNVYDLVIVGTNYGKAVE